MRQPPMRRGIEHLRAHAIAYAALFFAVTGSATAMTATRGAPQDRPEDEVLASGGTFVDPGSTETLLRANGLKVVGTCASDSARVRIGPIQEPGRPLRAVTVHADSQTLGYLRAQSTGSVTIGSAPPGDRGDFNAMNSATPRGSLDGSFLADKRDSGRCVFEASAIAS